uniref:OBG-type G domain-containing protein n=1 Tax=Eutreptiella gymnastica TaxID=73025 RepID=A0A7S1HXS2_9EUGL
MGILEKIKDIEDEISRTQKNKATEGHLGLLKGKLARYRSQLLEGDAGGGGGKGAGFEAAKSGDARVSMVGFPSAGKSTLLNKLTKTESATGAYEFTTLTCIPGVIEYKGTEIQLLDLPGIIEGAAEGKGRGKQVIATARTSDLILIVIDAGQAERQRPLLEYELEILGIRLNKPRPNIYLKKKPSSSMNVINYTATVKTTHLNEKLCKDILHGYKIHNAEILIREDATVDDFIDVVEGNRQYLPALYIYNKVDTITIEEVDRLARLPHSLVISCQWDLNLDLVVEQIWEELELVRVYTKKKGNPPEFEKPFIMRKGDTVEDLCKRLHQDFLNKFKYAMIWGTSAKHCPQRVGKDHPLDDEDVLQIMTQTAAQDKNQIDARTARDLKKRAQAAKKK